MIKHNISKLVEYSQETQRRTSKKEKRWDGETGKHKLNEMGALNMK